MRTAARDASTRAAAALRSGFRSTASATSALSSGSPKLRIQFGTTAPLRCGPAHLPGIFARADSGIMSAPAGGFFRAQPASTRLLALPRSRVERRAFTRFILVSAEESGEVFDDEPVELRLDADDHAADELDHRMLITGIVANWVARTPGCRARLATRPLAGARWTQPSRSYFALRRSASALMICALACASVASAARNSLSRLPRSLCACSRSARLPAPVVASAENC